MTHHDMLSVSNHYNPIAGCGVNTIRLFDGKYLGVTIGDTVTMRHVRSADNPSGTTIAVEHLAVSSMVVASLYQIIRYHGRANHAFVGPGSVFAHDSAERCLLSFYPDATRDDLFVAIYFA